MVETLPIKRQQKFHTQRQCVETGTVVFHPIKTRQLSNLRPRRWVCVHVCVCVCVKFPCRFPQVIPDWQPLCSHMFTWSIPVDWHRWSQSDNPSVHTCSPEASLLTDTDDSILTTPLYWHMSMWEYRGLSEWNHLKLQLPGRLTQVAPFRQPQCF